MSTSPDQESEVTKTPHAQLTGPACPFGRCERVIETVLSRLYVFEHDIYKWYRPVVAYYGNVRDEPHRQQFFAYDHDWNATVSPAVYLELVGIRYADDGSFRQVDANADDYLIRMKHLTHVSTLSEQLRAGLAGPEHIGAAIRSLLDAQSRLHARFMSDLGDVSSRGLREIYAENVSDLLNQLLRADEYISPESSRRATDRLLKHIKQSAYFSGYREEDLTVALDCHTDNVLFTESGELIVIDSMFPKRNWRIMDEPHTIARVAANAAVLGGPDQRDQVYAAYASHGRTSEPETALAHEARTALMQWSRRHLLGEHDLAERFGAYAHTLLDTLEA